MTRFLRRRPASTSAPHRVASTHCFHSSVADGGWTSRSISNSVYWTMRAFLFRCEYLNAPVSPLYVFGREQDVALQKARNTVNLRNHLRLWLASFRSERDRRSD
jgi:hypothetical protein